MADTAERALAPAARPGREGPSQEAGEGLPQPREASWRDQSEDGRMFRELMDRFTVLAETCARFSQDVYRRSGTLPEADLDGTVRTNLRIARTIFGKWSLDILAVAHLRKSIAFSELRELVGRIGIPVLKSKLRQLERMGLIQRDFVSKRPAENRYSLTHKGLMIARLGEPVFLYLRLASGWRHPVPESDPSSDP